METIDKNLSEPEEGFNAEIKQYLITTSKWAKFLAIVGFIGIGLMIIGAISLYTLTGLSLAGSTMGVTVPLIYIVFALLYFFPVYYLYKAAVGLRDGVASDNMQDLTQGFKYLKSHYKFLGISTIVIISIYILVIIVSILALLEARM